MSVFSKIKNCGIIPVVAINNSENAISLAKALLRGGIDVIEITFRTNAAEDSIKKIKDEFPEMLVGAGTILTMDQLKIAIKAGTKFIVSPGIDLNIVKYCQEKNVAIIPGAVTPTEIMSGINMGINIFKFFPANIYGGVNAIKSLSQPFSSISFVPTGGIGLNNLQEYLEEEKIIAVGGSWMVKSTLIDNQEFDKIEEFSKEAMIIAKKSRN